MNIRYLSDSGISFVDYLHEFLRSTCVINIRFSPSKLLNNAGLISRDYLNKVVRSNESEDSAVIKFKFAASIFCFFSNESHNLCRNYQSALTLDHSDLI